MNSSVKKIATTAAIVLGVMYVLNRVAIAKPIKDLVS